MAYLVDIFCGGCKRMRKVSMSGSRLPEMCHDCQAELATTDKRNHLALLETRSLEERVAKIEEWIYDFEKEWGPVLRRSRLATTRF